MDYDVADEDEILQQFNDIYKRLEDGTGAIETMGEVGRLVRAIEDYNEELPDIVEEAYDEAESRTRMLRGPE